MNEKTSEKATGLSRRQIIQLQKKAIIRQNKVVKGISYSYSQAEVELFLLAKFFKDCGYNYNEIAEMLIHYEDNKEELLNNAIIKMVNQKEMLEKNILKAKKMLERS